MVTDVQSHCPVDFVCAHAIAVDSVGHLVLVFPTLLSFWSVDARHTNSCAHMSACMVLAIVI
jgi:hypothetical protein